MADMDPHTVATFAFALLERNPAFRQAHSATWMRNMVVCVDTDRMIDVKDQMLHHYPDSKIDAVACYRPSRQMFVFFSSSRGLVAPEEVGFPAGGSLVTQAEFHDENIATRDLTVGMVLDSMESLASQGGPAPQVEQVSTVEVEAQLART